MEALLAVLAVLLMHVPLGFLTCCCEGCLICDSECGWTTVAGSGVTAGSGVIDFTSSNALVLSNATSPTGTTAVKVSASIYGQTNGDQGRLLFKYKDASNYWFAQIEWAAGANNAAVKLYKRVAGTNTQLGAFGLTAEGDNAVLLTVCYGESLIKVTEGLSGKSLKLWTATTVNDADYAGAAVATVGGGSLVKFTDFYYENAKASGKEDCVSCLGCDVAFDDFTRANDTDIDVNSPAGWTENSGSWEIASNALKCTASGTVTFGAAQPVGSRAMFVRTTAKISNTSTTVDIIVAGTDATHYYYCRFNPGANTAQVRYNDGGTHHDCCPAQTCTLTTGANVLLGACVTESGHITAYAHTMSADVPAVTAFAINNVYAFGDQCGLAATIGSGGNVIFDDFLFSQTQNADFALTCETCDFAGCGDLFCNLDVDFSGANFSSGSCGDCASLNAIISLPRRQSDTVWAAYGCPNGPLSTGCIWGLRIPGCGAGTFYGIVCFLIDGGTAASQRLYITHITDLYAGGATSCGASGISTQTGVTDATFDDTGATTYTFGDISGGYSWAAPPRSGVPCNVGSISLISATASPIV